MRLASRPDIIHTLGPFVTPLPGFSLSLSHLKPCIPASARCIVEIIPFSRCSVWWASCSRAGLTSPAAFSVSPWAVHGPHVARPTGRATGLLRHACRAIFQIVAHSRFPVPASPANRDYEAGFTVAMMLKDLKLSQEAAASSGASTPLGAHATELYDVFAGIGENATLDFSAIIRQIRDI
ncbi:MAG: NAD-binding protein [Planctomycetes bacterium]|nr:NAD-binding protein [Planctomycetota bacterium]